MPSVLEVSAEYQSPIPPPDMLERYEQMHPGFTDRWLKAMDEESQHRRQLQGEVVRGSYRLASRGQWCGLFVAIFGLSLGGYLFYTGHDVGGSVMVGGVLVSLVTAFLATRDAKRPPGDPHQKPQGE